MKNWIRAIYLACVIEVPFVASLALMQAKQANSAIARMTGNILVWYHILAIPVGHAVLIRWNFSSGPGQAPGSDGVLWFSIYAFQVIVTTPIIYALIRLTKRT